MAAMTMVASMHTRSPQIAVVARELALTFSESCVRPQVVKHTPGVANRLADILSRRFQPGVHFVVPQAFVGVPEVSTISEEIITVVTRYRPIVLELI